MRVRPKFCFFGLIVILLFALLSWAAASNIDIIKTIPSDIAALALVILPITLIILLLAIAKLVGHLMEIIDFDDNFGENKGKSSTFLLSIGIIILFFSTLTASLSLYLWFIPILAEISIAPFLLSLSVPSLAGFVFWLYLMGFFNQKKKEKDKKQKKIVQLFRNSLLIFAALSMLAASYMVAKDSPNLVATIKGSMMASMVLPFVFNILILGGMVAGFFGLRKGTIEHEMFAPALYPVFAVIGAILGIVGYAINLIVN